MHTRVSDISTPILYVSNIKASVNSPNLKDLDDGIGFRVGMPRGLSGVTFNIAVENIHKITHQCRLVSGV